MNKLLISIPENISNRLRVFIPSRQRSRVISNLIEVEISRREKELCDCAAEVEKDNILNSEMEEWNITINDGLQEE